MLATCTHIHSTEIPNVLKAITVLFYDFLTMYDFVLLTFVVEVMFSLRTFSQDLTTFVKRF